MESPSSPADPTPEPVRPTLDDLIDYLYGIGDSATYPAVRAELADPDSRLRRAKDRIDANAGWFRWLTLESERQSGRGRIQSTLTPPTERRSDAGGATPPGE